MILKKSHLLCMLSILALLLVSLGSMLAIRLDMYNEGWIRSDSTLTAHTIQSVDDSIRLACPPPGIHVFRIDFRHPETDSSIFEPLGLTLKRKSWNYAGNAPLFRSAIDWGRTIGQLYFTFEPDSFSLHAAALSPDFRLHVYVEKYRTLTDFTSPAPKWQQYRDDIRRNDAKGYWSALLTLLYVQDGPAGAYVGFSPPPPEHMIDDPCLYSAINHCYWYKGLWRTTLTIHGTVNNSRRQAALLLVRVRELVMEYYQEL